MNLTGHECRILDYLIAGYTQLEVAEKFNRAQTTVSSHMERARARNGCRTVNQLVAMYVRK